MTRTIVGTPSFSMITFSQMSAAVTSGLLFGMPADIPLTTHHCQTSWQIAPSGARLWTHADLTRAGAVFVGDTGFTLARNPDTVRGPDIAFIRTERLPQPIPSTFLDFAPDLVVEILSPDDRPGAILAKVGDWLDAGARLVWVVDPERRVARVYRQDGTEDVISGDGALLGEDVLPGFSCTLPTVL